jgi:ribosome-interacting GTPase 1
MPANLPPEYYEAEARYKQASSPQEKVAALEALISTVPKHKGTDKIRADLRRKLSRLRQDSARKKKSGKSDLYSIEKQGAAQIALIGLPNSGKSSLLAAMTNARPVIADYPLSTVFPLSGMMAYEDIQFQLVDLPPVGNESTDGWVSAILRNANILLLVVSLPDDPVTQSEILFDQIAEWKIPFLRNDTLDQDKMSPIVKPILIAANKSDASGAGENVKALIDGYGDLCPVVEFSSLEKKGIEELRRIIFENSRIIRVYAKQPGKKPDMATPFTLPVGSHVLDLAEVIHKEFVSNFRYACIWGSSKFDGQRVQKDYVLSDRDIVEYHLR